MQVTKKGTTTWWLNCSKEHWSVDGSENFIIHQFSVAKGVEMCPH